MAEGFNYICVQGDSVESIAAEHGHFWQTLWDDSHNSELKELRKDPQILFPGDSVYVPALREKEESKATDGRHTFKRKGVPSKLRLVLMENGKPRAAEKYVIELDGKLIEGTTAGDGSVEIPIPPTVKSGRLILSPGQKERIFPLNLGGLDPITELSGVQTRLRNLGFPVGEQVGGLNDETREAIEMFQDQMGLPVTGEPDAATRDKLKQQHGC